MEPCEYRRKVEELLGRDEGVESVQSIAKCWRERRRLCAKYAWAIPDGTSLGEIAKLSPLVEIGAGTGYWAMLLEKCGAFVVAYDRRAGDSRLHPEKKYHEVLEGTESVLKTTPPEFNLFLCWPSYGTPFASNALRLFRGQYVAYIGEGPGGCTGDDEFHKGLEEGWAIVKRVEIPRWAGVQDALTIYRRNPQS